MKIRRILPLLLILALAAAALAAQPMAPPSPPSPKPPAAPAVDLQTVFQQARQKFEAHDLKGALALLEPYGKDPSVPPPFLALLGAVYLELDRPADALKLLDPLAKVEDAGPAVLYNAARAALAIGQGDKADGYLERAIVKAPQSPALRTLGLRRGRQGRIADAYNLLRPWAAEHPDDGEARLAAAFCAIELGRPAEAEPLLTGLPDDNPQVRLLRGRVLLAKGDARGAVALLSPLEASHPPGIDRDLRWVLSDARLRTGDSAAAVRLLDGHTADDPELALLLAQAQQQAGNPAGVLATVAPFAAQIPDPAKETDAHRRELFAGLALEQGRALVAGTRWAEAVAALQKATALDPSNAPAWQVLGQALMGAGRRDEARAALAKFQELYKAQPRDQAAVPP
jgi:predicted Zn-dependent protease